MMEGIPPHLSPSALPRQSLIAGGWLTNAAPGDTQGTLGARKADGLCVQGARANLERMSDCAAPAATVRPMSVRRKAILSLALLLHISLLVSWRTGLWDRFTFDSTVTHGRRGWDFFALYQAGHNLLTGRSVYQSDNDKIDVVVPLYTPYRYLPLPACTIGVLVNAVPPKLAFWLWVGLVEMVLLVCARASWRLGAGSGHGAAMAAMWLCFTPYYLEIYLGQFSLVQASLVFAMMLAALRRELRWRSDLAWVVSLLWKQNTALFIPLYLRLKRRRALLWGSLAIMATSVPYFALHPAALAAFLGNLRGGPPSHHLGNLGVRQWLFSLVSALSPGLSSADHVWLQRVWVVAVLAIGLWVTFTDRRIDPLLHLCMWTTIFFLAYHDVWEHHYVMLLPVYVLLYHSTHAAWVLVLYLLTAVWTPYVLVDPQGIAASNAALRWTPLEPRILDVCYHASKALPTLVLWGYLVRLIRLTRLAAAPARS